MQANKVLVYGGRGQLGQAVIRFFKNHAAWKIISIDFAENADAHQNITVPSTGSWQEQADHIESNVKQALGEDKLDAILCVAGGWAGGNAASDDLIKTTDLMMKQSLNTSIISAHLATKVLKNDGILVLTGAAAATGPTPGMIGYGVAKAAVHHLVGSLAAKKSGLPEQATVAAILPTTLDTPQNRAAMPNANFKNWTPLEEVSK
eukprot:GEZU01036143.1.p2 GENE.GEZU01036143.1~~GEZU01036143.1.p2  ORF type:complete len:205 (-),score=81.73 GEZU01036143.1:608-1222(-)